MEDEEEYRENELKQITEMHEAVFFSAVYCALNPPTSFVTEDSFLFDPMDDIKRDEGTHTQFMTVMHESIEINQQLEEE